MVLGQEGLAEEIITMRVSEPRLRIVRASTAMLCSVSWRARMMSRLAC